MRRAFYQPYLYRTIAYMKKTFNVDAKLLREAKVACGATTYAETVRLGLEALVHHAASQQLKGFLGSEKHAQDVPRRRERPARKRSVA
jgi:hypothetical protein